MDTIGRHLIVELYDCDRALLDDVERMRRLLTDAAQAVGATVLAEALHRYEPQGVSGVVLIAESHLSVHTWPEAGYAAVDIFTCGGLDPRAAIESLRRATEAGALRVQEIVRGLEADLGDGAWMPEDVRIIAREAPLR